MGTCRKWNLESCSIPETKGSVNSRWCCSRIHASLIPPFGFINTFRVSINSSAHAKGAARSDAMIASKGLYSCNEARWLVWLWLPHSSGTTWMWSWSARFFTWWRVVCVILTKSVHTTDLAPNAVTTIPTIPVFVYMQMDITERPSMNHASRCSAYLFLLQFPRSDDS